MKKQSSHRFAFVLGSIFLLLFIIFTVLVKTVDPAAVTSSGAVVGFSSVNGALFELLGTNELCYTLSEVLGYIVLTIPVVFAVLALTEWIRRKSLLRVDPDLWILFFTYVITLGLYVLFEIVVINYRPIPVDGMLEASYPSSHTLLALVIMGTALMQICDRVSKKGLRIPLVSACVLLMVLIPIFRLLSGVHWATDILGSILLSTALIFLYRGFDLFFRKSNE